MRLCTKSKEKLLGDELKIHKIYTDYRMILLAVLCTLYIVKSKQVFENISFI